MSFLGQEAPPGYKAGIGRGALGFTTLSDIGPAGEAGSKGRGKEEPEESK